MIENKKILIIGGGIAGLASAVFLSDKGFDIELIESSHKLGGRISGHFDKSENIFIDNGQHILAGWYLSTFEYLRIIDGLKYLNFQKSLSVIFIDSRDSHYIFKCSNLPVPFNILSGLLKYKALSFKDKFLVLKAFRLIKRNKTDKFFHINSNDFLSLTGQTERIIKYFWQPLILAVFNSLPENISYSILSNVLNNAFMKKRNSTLVFPEKDLNTIFIKGAEELFKKQNIKLKLSTRCEKINIQDGNVKNVISQNGEIITADYYISALPFYKFKSVFEENIFNDNFSEIDRLRTSTIISIYLFYENDINDSILPFGKDNMIGITGKTIQWIFKKTSNIFSIIISGADFIDNLSSKNNNEIFEIITRELFELFPELKFSRIGKYKIIKERKATFIPDTESDNYRTPVKSKINNLFVVGDWTDTGLPSTIESAVRSAKCVSKQITTTG